MKPGPVTKPDNKNKTTTKKFDDDVISKNCAVIAIFRIYSKSGAIQKPDSGHIVWKTYKFINSNLLSYKKIKIEVKSIKHSSHTIFLGKCITLANKC